MNLELKKRIIKYLVWSVAMYASETWTLREVDRKKIEAFGTVSYTHLTLPTNREV